MLKNLAAYAMYLVVGLGIGVGIAKGYGWLTQPPEYVVGNYSSYHVGNSSKIIVLGTAWCQYCAKTRALFSRLGIEFQDYDVEKNDQYKAMYEELGSGPVPIILIDNVKIVGFRKDTIMRFLNEKSLL